ncbi:MAG: hypothetical protein ACRED5_00610 [Propylenella sp.]
MLVASALLLAVTQPGTAPASPKKALSDYSQFCQDAHLKCLNDCQAGPPIGYTKEADILACMKVCDDWLDDACDRFRPKTRVQAPVRPSLGGTIDPGTTAPPRLQKVRPGVGIAQ